MFWTTRRLRYVAASKHAITIGEEQTVRFAVEGDSLFVRDEGGKEQRLELVKIAQVAKAEAIPVARLVAQVGSAEQQLALEELQALGLTVIVAGHRVEHREVRGSDGQARHWSHWNPGRPLLRGSRRRPGGTECR